MLLKDTLRDQEIKLLTFSYRAISTLQPSLLSQFLSTLSETGKCQQKKASILAHTGPQWRHGNPHGCGCSGSAALPLPELNRDKAARLEDSYLDSGRQRRTGGQTKLAHQRGESTLQAISRSSLQWIGSPTGRPLGSEKAGHVSQIGWIGKRGDPPMSLEFRMTKNSKAGEISVLGCRTRAQSQDHNSDLLDCQ